MKSPAKPEYDLPEIEACFTRLVNENKGNELVREALKALTAMLARNDELERALVLLRRQRFGSKSEKVNSNQLALFVDKLSKGDKECADLLGQQDEEFIEEVDEALHCQDDVEIDESSEAKDPPKRKPGRRKLPQGLPRADVLHKMSPEECTCLECHEPLKFMRYECSEELEFTAASLVVKLHKREVFGGCSCKQTVKTAPGPQRAIECGQAGPRLLAEVVTDKYRYGLPLYRQSHRFENLGYKIPRSTLCNWVKLTAGLLTPIVTLLRKHALAGSVLATDGTGLTVLDKLHEGNRKRGALYCHIGEHNEVFFVFAPNQRGGPPTEVLKDFKGHLIKDGAPIYDWLFKPPPGGGPPNIIDCGCWMHCRRYFFKAFEAGDTRAAIALKYIKRLYKIEELAKRKRAGPKRLARVRRQKSAPIVKALWAWIAQHEANEPPDTLLGKALGYAIRQADPLEVFLGDPRIPIDNGEVERTIRTIAVTRKNYLFAGSDEGGKRAAVLYSIIASCERVAVDPAKYIADVLSKLAAGWKASRLAELLPQAWKAARDRVEDCSQHPE